MSEFDRKAHWDTIYTTKALTDVSWYQPVPETSLELIARCEPTASDTVIDIGGGDSFLTDQLLDRGFENIFVLDISEKALERAQTRLNKRAMLVQWITSDVLTFTPETSYSIWHDRAAFHFLTDPAEIAHYAELVSMAVKPGGYLIIGTFATNGPTKCSGIEIQQYDEASLRTIFEPHFQSIEFEKTEHPTPFGTTQQFLFGRFRKN